jgi:hypothetical protein
VDQINPLDEPVQQIDCDQLRLSREIFFNETLWAHSGWSKRAARYAHNPHQGLVRAHHSTGVRRRIGSAGRLSRFFIIERRSHVQNESQPSAIA